MREKIVLAAACITGWLLAMPQQEPSVQANVPARSIAPSLPEKSVAPVEEKIGISKCECKSPQNCICTNCKCFNCQVPKATPQTAKPKSAAAIPTPAKPLMVAAPAGMVCGPGGCRPAATQRYYYVAPQQTYRYTSSGYSSGNYSQRGFVRRGIFRRRR